MVQNRIFDYGYWLSAVVLLILSFLIYSPVYYLFFDSDMAIQVLMVSDFDFSDSLFFWGQNRLGSLLPILSIPLYKIGIEPIWAVSLVIYAMLFCSWLFTKNLIKDRVGQLAWLAMILFQCYSFKESIMSGHPYAPQFFVYSAIVYVLFVNKDNVLTQAPLLIFLFAIGFWVSEMMAAAILAFVIWLVIKGKSNDLVGQIKSIARKKWFVTIGALILAITFLVIIKITVVSPSHYYKTFNDLEGVISILQKLFLLIKSSVLFEFGLMSGFLVWMLVLLSISAFLVSKLKFSRIQGYLILTMIISFLMLIASYWVYRNNIQARYFSLPYWLLLLNIVILLSNYSRRWLTVFTLFIPIFSFGSMYNVIAEYDHFSKNRPNRDQCKAIVERHGDVGIIGDFWNSYIFESYRPSQINGVPHQHDFNRNYRHNYKAFEKDTILVFGRGWLEGYPDTLYQYGQRLIKVGEKPSYLNNYGVYINHHIDTMNFQFFDIHSSVPLFDSVKGIEDALLVNPIEQYLVPEVAGPKKFLDKGSYQITFLIRGIDNEPVKKMKLEVRGLISRKPYVEEYMLPDEIENDFYQAFKYKVKLEQLDCIDFNVYLGQDKGQVWFKHLIIEKLDEE